MNITFDKLTVEINREEAYILYSTLRNALIELIKTHWKHHPGTYEKYEASRLHMMEQLARFTGNDFHYDANELKKLLYSEAPPNTKI